MNWGLRYNKHICEYFPPTVYVFSWKSTFLIGGFPIYMESFLSLLFNKGDFLFTYHLLLHFAFHELENTMKRQTEMQCPDEAEACFVVSLGFFFASSEVTFHSFKK